MQAQTKARTLDQFLPQQLKEAASVSTTANSEQPASTAYSTGSAEAPPPRAAPGSSPPRRRPTFAPPILDDTPSPNSSNQDSQAALDGGSSVQSELEFRPIFETENGGYENAGHAPKIGHANGNAGFGIESSLGDLSLGGGDSNDPEHPESFCCPITTVSHCALLGVLSARFGCVPSKAVAADAWQQDTHTHTLVDALLAHIPRTCCCCNKPLMGAVSALQVAGHQSGHMLYRCKFTSNCTSSQSCSSLCCSVSCFVFRRMSAQ